MKKYIALLLTITMAALLLASCKDKVAQDTPPPGRPSKNAEPIDAPGTSYAPDASTAEPSVAPSEQRGIYEFLASAGVNTMMMRDFLK